MNSVAAGRAVVGAFHHVKIGVFSVDRRFAPNGLIDDAVLAAPARKACCGSFASSSGERVRD